MTDQEAFDLLTRKHWCIGGTYTNQFGYPARRTEVMQQSYVLEVEARNRQNLWEARSGGCLHDLHDAYPSELSGGLEVYTLDPDAAGLVKSAPSGGWAAQYARDQNEKWR